MQKFMPLTTNLLFRASFCLYVYQENICTAHSRQIYPELFLNSKTQSEVIKDSGSALRCALPPPMTSARRRINRRDLLCGLAG